MLPEHCPVSDSGMPPVLGVPPHTLPGLLALCWDPGSGRPRPVSLPWPLAPLALPPCSRGSFFPWGLPRMQTAPGGCQAGQFRELQVCVPTDSWASPLSCAPTSQTSRRREFLLSSSKLAPPACGLPSAGWGGQRGGRGRGEGQKEGRGRREAGTGPREPGVLETDCWGQRRHKHSEGETRT